MAGQDTMRRLSAIRKLARQMPLENCDERLGKIAEIASGKGDLQPYFNPNYQDTLAERLEAGMNSVAQLTEPPSPNAKPEKKRAEKTGRNRMLRSDSFDREET